MTNFILMEIWYILKFTPSESQLLIRCIENSGHTQTECQWTVVKARILSDIAMHLTQPIVWAYMVPMP